MKLLFSTALAALVLVLVSTTVQAASVYRAKYAVQKGDTLSHILYKKGVRKKNYQMYGRNGWIVRNMRHNKQVKNWRKLRVGEALVLILPRAALKPAEGARNLAAAPTPVPQTESAKSRILTKPILGPGNWDIRASLGVSRTNYSESARTDQTKTAGLFSLPQVTVSADHWRGKANEPAWQYGAMAALAHQAELNGVKFPVAWSGLARLTRRNITSLGAQSWLNPSIFLGGESFSQGTPDRSRTAIPTPLTSRTTVFGKVGVGAKIDTDLLGQYFEMNFQFNYIPFGTTKVKTASASESVRGLGADLRFVLWINKNLFSNVTFNSSRLTSSGSTLTGLGAGADLGWQF